MLRRPMRTPDRLRRVKLILYRLPGAKGPRETEGVEVRVDEANKETENSPSKLRAA